MDTLIPSLPPHYAPVTVPALLRRRASQHPERVAAVAASSGRYRSLTYRELDEASDRLAAALIRHWRLPRGATVAWALDNDHGSDALVLFHALLKVGLVNVPLNTRLTPHEIAEIAGHAQASAVVATTAQLAALAPLAQDRLGLAGNRLLDLSGGWSTIAATEALAPQDEPNRTDLASILYTSGTTGLPKGVEHTHESSVAAGISWADAFRLTGNDVLQSPFPIFSGAALHFNALSSLWAGGTVVIDNTDVASALERIGEYRSTVYVAVPSIYQYWLRSDALATADLSSLRILDYGGASMPLAVIDRLRAALPDVGLMQTYGLTEAGPGGTYLPEEYAVQRLGSIGSRGAGPFTRFRIVRDDGTDVGPDEIGELVLRGPSIMRGYHRDPEATAAVFLDGWLRSGDLVRYDETGFAYLVDRRKDLILRGGYNISSVEVENAVVSHPDVVAAAAFGLPHPALGEVVAAAVVLRPEAQVTVADLLEHVTPLLASFKRPTKVFLVDDLPRNASGKVLKRELTARFNE
jgi:acyl-CoA synthetase (AMP-forming)/AMP-acid ligase II